MSEVVKPVPVESDQVSPSSSSKTTEPPPVTNGDNTPEQATPNTPSEGNTSTPKPRKSTDVAKKKPEDFTFGKVIGSGSYSEVVLAQEKSTGQEFAIKILEKAHIIKYKKVPYVTREKEVSSFPFSRFNSGYYSALCRYCKNWITLFSSAYISLSKTKIGYISV